MAIDYLLLFIYLLLCFLLFPKIGFIKRSALSAFEVRLLLLLKLGTGLACAFYFKNASANFDYMAYNEEGKIQYNLLLKNPVLFFTDITGDVAQYGFGGLFEASGSFWAYLRFNLLYKCLALFNLLTRGNFYGNTALFGTIVFFGHIAIYRIYNELYAGNKMKILCIAFGLPSVLLYTSCVHKDGIIFFSLGITCFILHRHLLFAKARLLRHIVLFVLGLFIIFLFRNYVIVALLPAMVIGVCCKVFYNNKKRCIIIIYLLFILTFFLSSYSSFNLPEAVVHRKADFAILPAGNTNIYMNELQPSFSSFLKNLPQAVNHSLFRPYLWEFSQPSVIFTALELAIYQLIVLLFIFFRVKQLGRLHLFNIVGFALFLHMMFIIGYTIPNIGAIVRYRSIFWIFIICPAVCNINWAKLFSVFSKKNYTPVT